MSFSLKVFTNGNNAGDIFSIELLRKFTNLDFKIVQNEKVETKNLLLVGSILSWSDNKSIVVGSGFNAANEKCQMPLEFLSVRGPLTAARLFQIGLPRVDRFGDLGVLAGPVFRGGQVDVITDQIGIIPHYVDKKHPWIRLQKARGSKIIDIQKPVLEVLEEISKCKVILSSSLHGIIFAHSLGRPAAWIHLTEKVHGGEFKFYDYFLSLPAKTSFSLRKKVALGDSAQQIAKLARSADLTALQKSAKVAIERAINYIESRN